MTMADTPMSSSSSAARNRSSFILAILLLFPSPSSSSSPFHSRATESLVSSPSPSQCCFHHQFPWPSAAAATTISHHRRRRSSCQGASVEPCSRYYHHQHDHHHHQQQRPSLSRHHHTTSHFVHQKTDDDQIRMHESTSSTGGPKQQQQHLLLGLSLQELSNKLQGSGRALAVWDCLRLGLDPNLYYSSTARNNVCDGTYDDDNHHDEKMHGDTLTADEEDEMVGVMRGDVSDDAIYDAWIAATASLTMTKDNMINSTVYNSIGKKVLMNELPDQGRNNRGRSLGSNAWNKLQKCMTRAEHGVQPIINLDDEHRREHVNGNAIYTIDNSIASLSHLNVSPDGTTKLLLKMKSDGLEVESVIIPWMEKGFSTLCVSSQVGCRQGCTFCATGRMGKLRSLTTDEILVQVYFASKVCRIANNISTTRGDAAVSLPKVDNIVFMGMGEPADNAHAVVSSVRTMVDRSMFGLAQSKITISTVAPDPGAFATLGQAPAALAWSVHAVDDALRLKLVPTTKYSMEELRMGLVTALQSRANKLRRTMLEVALIERVNDSDDDAMRLAEFSQAIMNDVNGSKVVVNLIPYNAIDHPTYCTPSKERVLGFQKIITDGGVLCYVRTTRGDDESAACGQLATRKRKHIDDVVVA